MVMQSVQIIKTPLHLVPLFINGESFHVYSEGFSIEAYEYIQHSYIQYSNEIKFSDFVQKLSKSLERQNAITQKGEFSVKGDIISVWPYGYDFPIKLEFFGDKLESMYLYDDILGRKLKDLNALVISEYKKDEGDDLSGIRTVVSYQPSAIENKTSGLKPQTANLTKLIFTSSRLAETPKDCDYTETDYTFPPLFFSKLNIFEQEIEKLKNNGYEILIQTNHEDELNPTLAKYTKTKIKKFKHIPKLQAGLLSESERIAIFTDRELFGTVFVSKIKKSNSSNIQKLLRQFEGNIEIGDFVVHEDYGVGIYSGMKQEESFGTAEDYLLIKYAEGDELYVPIHQIEKITKYIGNSGMDPRLTRLGKASWEHLKSKVKVSVRLLAKELLEHYAKREISHAEPVLEKDSKEYKEFVNEFKFEETEDQIRSANEILEDLIKDKPMDRLLVGDVGFGKTEVMMRAAFKIVEKGLQVAVLTPTTVLTAQHFKVFKERFKEFPIEIDYISRFKKPYENKKVLEKLKSGKVDIVIGTHRLLSNDVEFKNLGLIILDEEQKFGVTQKEKLKKLNYGVHVLSVSATPIPRTLSLALSSLQNISIITTPPKGRQSIKTEIIKDDWNKAVKAIEFEVQRGGQVYFLHNEVQTIQSIKRKLETLAPKIRFVFAHGQMNPDELDKIMFDFYERKFDCLICTTIIENGIDLSNVNTIIINKAHKFGLSQLYQLRGRVGRSDEQAFCYLFYEGKELKDYQIEKDEIADGTNDKTKKFVQKKYLERLQSLVDNQDLGAGFRIASKDLEIRGAGDLLGKKQHGHISQIGYALYIELLAQEVERVREVSKYTS